MQYGSWYLLCTLTWLPLIDRSNEVLDSVFIILNVGRPSTLFQLSHDLLPLSTTMSTPAPLAAESNVAPGPEIEEFSTRRWRSPEEVTCVLSGALGHFNEPIDGRYPVTWRLSHVISSCVFTGMATTCDIIQLVPRVDDCTEWHTKQLKSMNIQLSAFISYLILHISHTILLPHSIL